MNLLTLFNFLAFCSGAVLQFNSGDILDWQQLWATTSNLALSTLIAAWISCICRWRDLWVISDTCIWAHGLVLAFCRGATGTRIHESTSFFRNLHSFYWSTPTFILAFCGGAYIHRYHTVLSWTYVWNLQQWDHSAWIILQVSLTATLTATVLYILQFGNCEFLRISPTPFLVAFCGGAWIEAVLTEGTRHRWLIGTVCAIIFNFWVHRLVSAATGSNSFHFWYRISSPSLSWWHSSGCPTFTPLRGESGPKSGHQWPRACLRLVFLVPALLFAVTNQATGGGEGCGRAMTATGTSTEWVETFMHQDDVKLHGLRPPRRFGDTHWPQDGTKVVKRSYKRAFLKAVRDGHCWYRGQCFRASDFQLPPQLAQKWTDKVPTTGAPCTTQPSKPRLHKDRQLRVVQWNVSGLSTAKLDEICCWLHTQPLDVVILLETHWQFTNEWCDANWNYVHCGDSLSKSAGILCLVSKKLSRLQDLRWAEVLAGRLLHIQLRFPARHVDILAGYQYTNSHQNRKHAYRSSWWHSLDQYLTTLSKRNILLLAGDFNCSLPFSAGHVGYSHFHWQGQRALGVQHDDAGLFLSIVRAHNLVALNTFDPTIGPTFWHGDACSRIDFFLTRHPPRMAELSGFFIFRHRFSIMAKLIMR